MGVIPMPLCYNFLCVCFIEKKEKKRKKVETCDNCDYISKCWADLFIRCTYSGNFNKIFFEECLFVIARLRPHATCC